MNRNVENRGKGLQKVCHTIQQRTIQQNKKTNSNNEGNQHKLESWVDTPNKRQ